MRIVIVAMGSRGDVQPYVALGKGLLQAGHTVRLLASENYGALVRGHGLDFWGLPGDVQAVAQSEEMAELLERGNFLAISRFTARAARRAGAGTASCAFLGAVWLAAAAGPARALRHQPAASPKKDTCNA